MQKMKILAIIAIGLLAVTLFSETVLARPPDEYYDSYWLAYPPFYIGDHLFANQWVDHHRVMYIPDGHGGWAQKDDIISTEWVGLYQLT
jgi:hypothetical protein